VSTSIIVLRLLAISQVLLFAGALALSTNPCRLRAIGMALALGITAYLMLPLADAYVGLYVMQGFALAASAIPPLLLLLTWELFEDDRSPSLVGLSLILVYMAVAGWVQLGWNPALVPANDIATVSLQVAKFGFAVGSIVIVWKGRAHDLVERRLKFRRVFVVSVGLLVATVVATELIAGWRVPMAIELLGMATIFSLALAINLLLLQFKPAVILTSSLPPAPLPDSDTKDPLISELTKVMRGERLYADHDLRIGELAKRLEVPEYQLRRVINQTLGYRNFNQFINRYRIDEAAERLVSEQRTPVLTIALDVGFRSISSFNTAFRRQHGCPASIYRNRG
jgi:AraC-like DNA-binding protein